jgi:uncharacterized caspase-like protein
MEWKKIVEIVSISLLVITSGFSIAISAASIQRISTPLKDTEQLEDVEYYALVIGVEEFAGYDTPIEEYLDESATAFYEKLIESDNWKEENIKFLLNEEATKDKIHDSIVNWLAEKEDEEDIVLIYYTDHGWKTPIKDRLKGHAYVFTYNATSWAFDETKISDKEFDSWVDKLDSKHITIILDHCYSGRMLALRQQGRTVVAAGGKYLFCPCNWSDYLESGIFTYYLLEGLSGIADINKDGWVTAREAFYYARWPVIFHSAWLHFPYFHKVHNVTMFIGPQVPYLYDYHIGKIPLIKL